MGSVQVVRVGEVFRPLRLLQTQEGSQCQGAVGGGSARGQYQAGNLCLSTNE